MNKAIYIATSEQNSGNHYVGIDEYAIGKWPK
jgi:hypothetical protein